ncbi:outer membrane lipoprotein chaperone LolA [Salinisphaera sp. SWV1]|uniref:outer membrane lipoprotein chaperone LolA n=1 Tax=unclassified Salinisphaera TaxID=2649847 RepID=UPI003F85BC8C
MRMTRWLIAFVMLFCVAGLAQAESGSKALQGFYNKVNTLSADFQQVQRDDNGNIVQQASGTFLLSRPKKFRWEYKKPYKQIIVSNGKVFKFYDVDLAQVTVRDIGATLKATPALLLTGGEALNDAFKITNGGQRDGLTWVHLTPKAKDTDFKSVDLGLKNDVPALMKLHDHLGQTTSINFGNVKINPKIPESKFTLKVPKNVEVVDGRANGNGGQGASR